MRPQPYPTIKFSLPPPISERGWNVCRELAYVHLKHLGADITKPAVRETVGMIYRNQKFVDRMKEITETPFDRILDSPPNDRAGTRAKTYLKQRGITNVESLVRLSEKHVQDQFGFGLETLGALRDALRKNDLGFGMLLPTPLGGNHAE